ncbi:MAG: NigD-like protein [Prevotellaceae bacterium]|jgi:hypothetical protein|nr:NigD-like protein [Prevotellaceae bacterium]
MKRINIYITAFVLFLLATFALSACMNNGADTADKVNSQLAMSTLRLLTARDYYFDLDNGKKMYPGDTTDILNYPLVDGQRTIVRFLPLEEKKAGYDYNVKVIQIENILCKDIIPLTEENAGSIGNDRINIDRIWITGNYLNVEYLFYQSKTPQTPHTLEMVINRSAPATDNAAYLSLEFRHNAYADEEVIKNVGLVSFRLNSIAGELTGKQGVAVTVNSIYDGERTYKVERERK